MDLNALIRSSFAQLRASPENPTTSLSDPADWLIDALGAGPSATGMHISESSALRMIAVFDCIRIRSETLASLPLEVFRRRKSGSKEKASDHPVNGVLHDEFNPAMTSLVGRETVHGHVVGRGNGYALIERDGAGDALAIWPMPPDCVMPDTTTGKLLYWVTDTGARILGMRSGVIFPNEILHVPGIGYDGIRGYSPIYIAREAIGLGLAAEKMGAKFFANDARPSVLLTSEAKLTPVDHARLLAEWTASHQGVSNAHKLAILSGNLKMNTFGVPPDEAQFLETRKFQVAEIARLFRVPLALLDEHDKAATYASVEQFMLSFVIHTVRPDCVRWEQELNRKLFTARERGKYFAEFNVDGLLRGDIKTRYEAYQIAIMNGMTCADEVRGRENMNPLPNRLGEKFYRPANLVEVGADASVPDSPANQDEGAVQ